MYVTYKVGISVYNTTYKYVPGPQHLNRQLKPLTVSTPGALRSDYITEVNTNFMLS